MDPCSSSAQTNRPSAPRGERRAGDRGRDCCPDAAMQTLMLAKHDGTPRASKDHGDERGWAALAATVAELHGRVIIRPSPSGGGAPSPATTARPTCQCLEGGNGHRPEAPASNSSGAGACREGVEDRRSRRGHGPKETASATVAPYRRVISIHAHRLAVPISRSHLMLLLQVCCHVGL